METPRVLNSMGPTALPFNRNKSGLIIQSIRSRLARQNKKIRDFVARRQTQPSADLSACHATPKSNININTHHVP